MHVAATCRFLVAGGAITQSAQAQLQTATPTAAECSASVAALDRDKTAIYSTVAHLCGAQGAGALAGAVARTTRETDAILLAQLFGVVVHVRDGGIFAATSIVAGDPFATASARSAALVSLFGQARDAAETFRQPMTDLAAPSGTVTCQTLGVSETDVFRGGLPMPPLYATVAQATASAISADPNAPSHVRAIARCIAELLPKPPGRRPTQTKPVPDFDATYRQRASLLLSSESCSAMNVRISPAISSSFDHCSL